MVTSMYESTISPCVTLIILSLASWRFVYMLVREDGPYDMFIKLRELASKSKLSPLGCLKCTSIWIAVLPAIYIASSVAEFIIYWFAISAGVVLVDAVVDKLES